MGWFSFPPRVWGWIRGSTDRACGVSYHRVNVYRPILGKNVVETDPLNGEELYAIPQASGGMSDVFAMNLTLDENGNIYSLYNINT
jgi:hypothetical protein